MSDPDSVAARTVHRGTELLLRHLTLVGLFLEDRAPARERAEAKIGDLAAALRPTGSRRAQREHRARTSGLRSGRSPSLAGLLRADRPGVPVPDRGAEG